MIYIAGPLSHAEEAVQSANIQTAVQAYLQLIELQIPAICPHLSGLAPGAFDLKYDHWISNGLRQLQACKAIWLLPKWPLSRGTLLELAEARRLGQPVYYSLHQVVRGVAPHWLSLGDLVKQVGTPDGPNLLGGKYWDDRLYREVLRV